MEFIASYIVPNWQNMLIEGVIVVSLVIFIMGVLKASILNKIKNEIVRKVVLTVTSLALVVPATALSVYLQGLDFSTFWIDYVVNAVLTILGYWAYRNFGCKDLIDWVGKKFIKSLFVSQSFASAHAETKAYVSKTLESSKTKYKDDDLTEI